MDLSRERRREGRERVYRLKMSYALFTHVNTNLGMNSEINNGV